MTNHLFRVAHKTRPRSELLEPAIEATETAVGGQPAASHSMGDLLSFPQQAACCQDFIQPGAIPSRRVVEASVYRNQLDQDFPRVFDDFDEYRSARQDALSVLRQREIAYPVDERKHVPRPSTPIFSPARIPRTPRSLLCPLISVTSDNETSSVIYQDESDASDNKIEEEDNMKLDEVATCSLNYPMDTLNPFELITAPPREYAEAANDNKHPLTFDRNVFDAIPYIDQTEDSNLAECRVQIESSDKCERCNKADRNSRDSQKRIKVDCDYQQTLNVPLSNFETATYSNPNFSSIESTLESKLEDFSHLRGANNNPKHALNVDERCEDRVLKDVFNSEDCADESSSTINDDCASSRVEEGISTPKMYTIMPELHLDLSGLNSDVSSDEPKTEKCWKSPEEVRLGCGRVAALAKHFSKLGDAGLIKFKSTKLTDSRQFVSEPNITLSEKDIERLSQSCYAQKEYKSDSNLANKNSRICPAGKHVILSDVDTDRNDFAIEESHRHHGARRVTIARIPLMDDNKDRIAIAKGRSASMENTSSNDSQGQVFSMCTKRDATLAKIKDDNKPTDNDKSQVYIDAESSKLSLEQQRVIAEQLEQFSNLNNTDAPLFIPERSAKQILPTSLKNENNVKSALSDSDSSSSSSPPSPSSSIVLSLSNVAESSPLSKNIGPYCRKRPKSCLFIDICHSSAKLRSNSSENPLMLPSRHKHNKLNILRMRIARSLCSSENNLIGAVICEKEEIENLRGESAKLTRSCESIPNSKFLSDSADRLPENLDKDIDSLRTSRDRSKLKEKTRWYRPRSLEELKSKKGSRKLDNSTNSASARTAKDRTRFGKFFGDKSDCENGEGMRRNRHLSLEELRSERESREEKNRRNLSEIAQVQRSDWTLRKRFRAKLRTSCDRLKGSALELSRGSETRDEKRQRWGIGERECRSELDISRRKSDSERMETEWRFREISSMRDDDRSTLRKLPPRVFMH